MTEERVQELKKIAYSRQLHTVDYVFNGKYNNDEIEFLLEEHTKINKEKGE